MLGRGRRALGFRFVCDLGEAVFVDGVAFFVAQANLQHRSQRNVSVQLDFSLPYQPSSGTIIVWGQSFVERTPAQANESVPYLVITGIDGGDHIHRILVGEEVEASNG